MFPCQLEKEKEAPLSHKKYNSFHPIFKLRPYCPTIKSIDIVFIKTKNCFNSGIFFTIYLCKCIAGPASTNSKNRNIYSRFELIDRLPLTGFWNGEIVSINYRGCIESFGQFRTIFLSKAIQMQKHCRSTPQKLYHHSQI